MSRGYEDDGLAAAGMAECLIRLFKGSERQRERDGENPGTDAARRLSAFGAQVEVQSLSSEGQDVGHLLLAQAVWITSELPVIRQKI